MRAIVYIRHIARGCTWSALLLGAALAGSALAEAEEDIRDIRGPKSVAPGSWVVPAVLAGVIVVAVCAYAVWRRPQRGTRRRSLTLSEQTLERLEETRPLMRPATAREFGIAASEVIRNYIEKRFNVVATQRTTEEFLQTLLQSSNETLARHRSLLEQFLQQCDFVKFAGASLAVTDMESLLQSARGFVLETGEPRAA
jgi:HAMP domain-containing protein